MRIPSIAPMVLLDAVALDVVVRAVLSKVFSQEKFMGMPPWFLSLFKERKGLSFVIVVSSKKKCGKVSKSVGAVKVPHPQGVWRK